MAEDSRRQVLTLVGLEGAPEVVCSLDVPQMLGDSYAELLALASGNSPALASSRAQVVVARADLDLARTRRWTDVTVGLGFQYANYAVGDPGCGATATVQMDLPLWNRYQGDVIAAQHGVSAAEEGVDATARDVASKVSALLADYDGSRREAEALRGQVLPAAARAAELADNAFATGKAARLEFLDRRRELKTTGLDLLRAQLMQAVAAI